MGTATPVIITVYPRNDGVLSRRLVAGIRIPTMYQQAPPPPSDTSIRIEERPGMTVYALYVVFNVFICTDKNNTTIIYIRKCDN